MQSLQLKDGASIVIRSREEAAKINVAPVTYYPAATAGWAGVPTTAMTVGELAKKLSLTLDNSFN